jgi:hypothetical protein
MANVNNPHGLRPLMRTLHGGAPEAEEYTKAAAYGQAIFKWDPVTLLAGVLNGPASGITAGTTRLLGVSLMWSAASTLATHQVMISPDAMYEAQGDSTTELVAAVMGYDANLNLTGTAGGGVTRDNSGVQVDSSTVAVTSSLDVNVLRLFSAPDNAYGAYARVEVRINKHLLNHEVTQT